MESATEAINAGIAPTLNQVRQDLEKTLLAIGGSRVVCLQEEDNYDARVPTLGRLFTEKVRLRKGTCRVCHANAAALWARDVERYLIVTGYGLNDGVWLKHSWVLHGKTVYETTVRREMYFGVALSPVLAFRFWCEEFRKPREWLRFLQDRPDFAALLKTSFFQMVEADTEGKPANLFEEQWQLSRA